MYPSNRKINLSHFILGESCTVHTVHEGLICCNFFVRSLTSSWRWRTSGVEKVYSKGDHGFLLSLELAQNLIVLIANTGRSSTCKEQERERRWTVSLCWLTEGCELGPIQTTEKKLGLLSVCWFHGSWIYYIVCSDRMALHRGFDGG